MGLYCCSRLGRIRASSLRASLTITELQSILTKISVKNWLILFQFGYFQLIGHFILFDLRSTFNHRSLVITKLVLLTCARFHPKTINESLTKDVIEDMDVSLILCYFPWRVMMMISKGYEDQMKDKDIG